MGRIFRLFALLGFLFTLLVLAAVAVAGYLLIDGGASAPECATGASGSIERASKSLAFDAKLAAFMAVRGRVPVENVSFDEAEASARAARYFAQRTERISDVLVCFDGGQAEGFMLVDTVLGRKVGVRAAGGLDLSGPHPTVQLGRARIGGVALPGFVRQRIADAVNGQLSEIQIGFPLSLSFETDRAVLTAVR